jgi:trans-aconitate methyltransferase
LDARTFPQAKLFGSELFTAGLDIAARRVPSATFFQIDARKVPFVDEFDVVAVLDVLEHIEEDEAVLAQIHGALKTGGTLLVTVPQHKWLWSATDVSSCHVRRYDAAELHRKIEAADFTLVRSTSFVSLLLPLMIFSRMTMHRTAASGADSALDEMKISPWLNGLFFHILRIEQIALRRGLDFPLGGSRLVVARKSSN